MKPNLTIYILVTLALVVFGVVLTYYFTTNTITKNRLKGYEVSFPYKCSDGEIVEEVKRYRKYITFQLTADTIQNNIVINNVQQTLTQIKLNGDSIRGVHVEFTDDTPYKYYLKTISICNEYRPRLFLPYLNHVYAFGKSKFQMTRDSLIKEQAKKDSVPTMEITGQMNLDY